MLSASTGLVVIGACVILQGFFSGSEMALVSANRARLQAKATQGNQGAKRALDLLAQEDRLLATCLIGTNGFMVTGSTLAAYLFVTGPPGGYSETVVAMCFLPFALVLGEAVPKTVYQYHADTIAPVVAYPLSWVQRLLRPPLWAVSLWTGFLKAKTKALDADEPSREDIVDLLEGGSQAIDPEDRRLIQRVFAMTGTVVGDCMTPLVDVVAIERSETIVNATRLAIDEGHSRLLVYEDRVDNLVGVVDCRDLLLTKSDGELHTLVMPAKVVPESKRADQLLRELRRNGDHLVVVVDEYGGSTGIVTLEDLVEELVGEIRDERDRVGPRVRRINDYEWRVPARTSVEELQQAIGAEVPEGEYETVSGLVLTHVGRIPRNGEIFHIQGLAFIVERASDRAIEQLRVRLLRQELPQP